MPPVRCVTKGDTRRVGRARGINVRAFLMKPTPPELIVETIAGACLWEAPPSHSGSYQLARVEWECLNDAIQFAAGNMAQAARLLGMPRHTLYRKLRKYPGHPTDGASVALTGTLRACRSRC